jgi:hypothetical protein
MRKRSLVGETPDPKRAHEGATPATAGAAATRGRLVLDVGGSRFVSCRSTLEANSTYFRSLLSRWADENSVDDPIFIDADADAFQILLSYMRNSTILLPSADHGLCSRVLLCAEFLGLEQFLVSVKARAHANSHPEADAAEASAAAFDEEFGTLQQAIEAGVLPARYFAAVPPAPPAPPTPPERTIKALYPVSGYRAAFNDDTLRSSNSPEESQVVLPVLSLALVVLRDGREVVDALVQPDGADYEIMNMEHDGRAVKDRDEATRAQHVFASELAEKYPWEHWCLLGPASDQTLVPIPPGTVRGVWKAPAITRDDAGKMVRIVNGCITVDGNPRNISWGDNEIPSDVAGKVLEYTGKFDVGDPVYLRMSMNGISREIPNPALVGPHDSVKADAAFASIKTSHANGKLEANFYLPMKSGNHVMLTPASQVEFSGKTLAGFEHTAA